MTQPDCKDFKPSPAAAWICYWWVDSPGPFFDKFTHQPIGPNKFCRNWQEREGPCPTSGLHHKPRSNYSPGDDGETD